MVLVGLDRVYGVHTMINDHFLALKYPLNLVEIRDYVVMGFLLSCANIVLSGVNLSNNRATSLALLT